VSAADYDHSRCTAYAAVTASFDDDSAPIIKLVRELVESPTDAASGLLALIQACGGDGRAMGQRPGGAGQGIGQVRRDCGAGGASGAAQPGLG
jgi:hypothetical protein